MTLPSSGTLRFSDIRSEFSDYGTANNLRAYLRGAGIVPDIAGTAGIPTSGTLALRDFLGASSGIAVTKSPPGNVTNNDPVNNGDGTRTWTTGSYTFTSSVAGVSWQLYRTIVSPPAASPLFVATGSTSTTITGYFTATTSVFTPGPYRMTASIGGLSGGVDFFISFTF